METFAETKGFFRPKWEDLHDPFLMQDMDNAVERINTAVAQKEKIMVFGDYDVDGTTSVALMTSFLQDPYTSSYPVYSRSLQRRLWRFLSRDDHAASLGISLLLPWIVVLKL